MTTNTRYYQSRPILVICLLLSGCMGWTGPQNRDLVATDPLPPSKQFAPTVRGPQPPARAESLPVRRPIPAPDSLEPSTPVPAKPTSLDDTVIRGQQPDSTYGDDDYEYSRRPLPVSGEYSRTPAVATAPFRDDAVAPAQYGGYTQGAPAAGPYNGSGGYGDPAYGAQGYAPGYGGNGYAPDYVNSDNGEPQPPIGYAVPGTMGPEFRAGPSDMPGAQPMTGQLADLIVNVREQQTGRFMFGVGVNSDAGLTGQIVLDEYNFDWRRFPRGVDDILNGTAWRGGGQRLRIEAIPGAQLQRYLVNFTEPYLFDTNVSLNLSGFLYDRQYYDWDERRVGGRVGLGYRLTPNLSLTSALRLESIDIHSPRVRGVTELEEVLGTSTLYSGRLALTQDTRDSAFAATEGYYLEVGYEQVFGTFSYPRGNIDFRKYFLLNERPDGSGRHVLGLSWQVGMSGKETPLYENYFAGGYSTLRGFRFRSAAPQNGGIYVGGEFSFLGSAEYMFPITADDMLKGVVFCDYGTIEEKIQFNTEDFRVAVGTGLRIAIPAMGPAPIALDLAVPLAREQTDRIQNFSFFVGFGR